jgi:hypothetical protein
VAGQPEGGDAITDPLRHWLIIGVMVGLALLLTAYAKRSLMSAGPVLLGMAAGLLYGVQDALTRVSGQRFSEGGLPPLVTGWQVHGVVALGITGLVLVQSAFETAPLRMSLPALTAAQPLAGIACGVGSSGTSCGPMRGLWPGRPPGLPGLWWGWCLLGLHPAMPSGAAPKAREARKAKERVRDLRV